MFPHGTLETAPQHALDSVAKGGQKAEETERVGEDAGRHEQRSSDQDDRAIDERSGRHALFGEIALNPTQCRQTLRPRQRCADHAGCDDQRQRGERPEPAADFDQECQLDRGDDDKEDE